MMNEYNIKDIKKKRVKNKARMSSNQYMLTVGAVIVFASYFLLTSYLIKLDARFRNEAMSHGANKIDSFVHNPDSTGSNDESIEVNKEPNHASSPIETIGTPTDSTSIDKPIIFKPIIFNDNANNGDYRLKAYIEPINQKDWEIKPLPVRNTTTKDLKEQVFDRVKCSTLPQQLPTSEEHAPTNRDPFLPWIHDVFPTADGKYIQFIAQNKRRCQSGTRMGKIKEFFQPNIALFQHVPVSRLKDKKGNWRYRISSHQEADLDGIETRFICRFKPSMEETLSEFNLNYDYHTLRLLYKASFTKEGFDNHMIWSSQLLFKCPVPAKLQEQIRLGKTVTNDYANQFIDIIPIRTPPRYGSPTTYLPPRLYADKNTWEPKKEWGDNHVLPMLEDSGRWENIPICKPSLMTYPDHGKEMNEKEMEEHDAAMADIAEKNEKKKLIACTWTSSSFRTRGGFTTVNDGDQRLMQWLEFNQMVGVDHVYIFDNTGAFSDTQSLKPVTDLFPGFATRINWPAKVCNNGGEYKAERSSQYAATMSCHLRFGAHSDWLMGTDTDEYMTPLGEHNSLKEILNDVEKDGQIKVLNWKSKRSKPRLQYFDVTPNSDDCKKNECFDPALPENKTFLEVYNCNIEKPPRKNVASAEKAIYKPDFVKLFFVHYATVTTDSQIGKPEADAKGLGWKRNWNGKPFIRYADEGIEGTMLHTKAIVAKETNVWNRTAEMMPKNVKVGLEWPRDKDEKTHPGFYTTIHGSKYHPNCYPVEKIDVHWVPKLEDRLEARGWKPTTNKT